MIPLEGLVTKNQNGYYSVCAQGSCYLCKIRGKLKRHDARILVGDRVRIEPIGNMQAMITDICPRTNQLMRPPIANLDQVLLVASVDSPPINTVLLDRVLMMCVHNHISPLLCFTKMDLQQPNTTELLQLYARLSYPVYSIDNHTDEPSGSNERTAVLAAIRQQLRGKVTAVCGQSGVGKSTLLNALAGHEQFATQAISHRIGRGKNTTRHAVICEIQPSCYIADTPGFAVLDYLPDQKENIAAGFCDIHQYEQHCYFHNCTHRHEPRCAVKESAQVGDIAQERYRSYVTLMDEWEKREKEMFR